MRATLLFPHKIKNRAFATLVDDYLKLARRTLRIDLEVVAYADRSGQVPERLLDRLRRQEAIFLSERGKEVTSGWFKEAFETAGMQGQTLLFVVGDANGLPPAMEAACARKICLSKLTMPHELALVVLAEQFWRAASMISGHPYHR